MRPNPQKTEDLVTFTEQIVNGKCHFLSSDGNCNTLSLLDTFVKTLKIF